MNPADFFKMIAEGAQRLHKEHGIFASTTMAQAALETGYGKFIPVDKYTGKKSYNLFGVKGVGPAGSVVCQTWEVYGGQKVVIDAKFRAYNNFYESLLDHNKVLLQDRYAPVRNAKDGEAAAMQLHPCGYATDPDYGTKLVWIIRNYGLAKYDQAVVRPSGYATYTVKSGDTLSKVAAAHKVSLSELLQVNPQVANPNLIVVGQVINIPKSKGVPKLDAATKNAALQAIDKLAAAGLLNNPEYWKARVEESLPVWAYMLVEARKLGK